MKTRTINTVSDEKIVINDGMWFVTMTDKFLSGWGCAEGKIAKRVIICNNFQEAREMKERLSNPKYGMLYVNITDKLPRYTGGRYTTSYDKFTKHSFTY